MAICSLDEKTPFETLGIIIDSFDDKEILGILTQGHIRALGADLELTTKSSTL
jgi:hypothetical protein